MPENNPQNGSEREPSGQGSFDEFLARYLNAQQARQQAAEGQRTIDISRFLTQRTQQALAEAGSYAVRRGQTEVDALHMLRVLAENAPVHDVLTRMGVSVQQLAHEVEARLPVARDGATVTEAPDVTPSLQRALFHASRSPVPRVRPMSIWSISSSHSCSRRTRLPHRSWQGSA